jgi:integrase/recombinase XerD
VDRSSRVRVTGPLAAYAPGFRAQLAACGYAPSSAAAHLLLMARMSRWLDATSVDAETFTPQQVGRFFRAHRAQGRRFPRSSRGLVPLLSYLRGIGAIPPEQAAVLSVTEELLARFDRYLASERGLGAGTMVGYVHAARLFLDAVGYAHGRDLGRLTPADVRQFLLAECGRRSVASAKSVVSGLRAWLRFLHVQGITATSLSGCVPAVPGWSGTSLPRAIDPTSVKALLASCDRRTVIGRRDFAVLLVMSRLGLRIGEVARLALADVDWRAGQILVRGKANRIDQLPLPVDVGQALADYVQHGRPPGDHRELFLRVLAPLGAITPTGLKVVVHAACARAGLPPLGAHRLRHTVASELLRHGAGLPEIGQVLRHRSIASTTIYAKVDAAALRQLARPWPGGGA